MQIIVSIAVNSLITVVAGSIAGFLAQRPDWVAVQNWTIEGVLTELAVKMASEVRK